ncbi:hypothetical protein F4804DRAFT_240153 [Jackrogersella minutella]|nr:hypothetical protein F4804DRAFT_240153 [Jackrogersella minutella]
MKLSCIFSIVYLTRPCSSIELVNLSRLLKFPASGFCRDAVGFYDVSKLIFRRSSHSDLQRHFPHANIPSFPCVLSKKLTNRQARPIPPLIYHQTRQEVKMREKG